MTTWLGLAGCGGKAAVEPGVGGAGGAGLGGGAQGGDAQGGGAQGGGGQGGSAQGGGSGGGVTSAAECTTANECQLENSCCNCQGLPTTEPPEPCDMDCFAPLCESYTPKPVQAECHAGRCVTNVDCDHAKVVCLSPQPECPPGQTAAVNGACWGPCLPSTECARVGSCAQCGPDQACVTEVAQLGPEYHCVDLPETCNGKADCACLGDSVCVGTFYQCVDAADGVIQCECPDC